MTFEFLLMAFLAPSHDIMLAWIPSANLVRYASRIMYDGTKFNGWQYQVRSRTVQLEVERALNLTLPAELRDQMCIRTVAAGRTDAGVHARGQVIHFDLPSAAFPSHDQAAADSLQQLINSYLPDDVRLWNVSRAPAPTPKNLAVNGSWHAMYNTLGKLYTYRFSTKRVADPLERLTRAHVSDPLDMEQLEQMTNIFEGTHDFQVMNFANRLEHKRKASKKGADFTTLRTVQSVKLVDENNGQGHYRLEVRLEGALQRMVRNMMGGLWLVAKGDMEEEELKKALSGPMYPIGQSPIRAAPAHGLTLEMVYYDDY